MKRALAAVVVVWILPVGIVFSGVFDEFGAGSAVMGGVPVAVDEGPASTYNNPAGLAGVGDSALEFTCIASSAHIRLHDRPAEHDTISGMALHFMTGVGSRLGLGCCVYVPSGSLVETSVRTPAEPRMALFNDRFDVVQMAAGIGFRVNDRWRLGLGLRMITGLELDNPVYLYISNYQDPLENDPDFHYSTIGGTSKVKAEYSLTAGVNWQPAPAVTLGLAYRDRLSVPLSMRSTSAVEIGGIYYLDIPMRIWGNLFFEPRRVSMGGNVALGGKCGVNGEVSWEEWSDYADPRLEVEVEPIESNPPFFEAFPHAAFEDIWGWRLGAYFRPGRVWMVSAGLRSAPSPAPTQSGATNLVDCDRWILSAGAALQLSAPAWLAVDGLTITTFGQFHDLTTTRVGKDDPELHGESYSASGSFCLVGMGILISF
ncbi:outer membrane protein transport protein [bacterium]|nr:outer membrane protein transport protein [candidate division CSSED10-310 bacterium]